jgi:hypothetical protein
MCNGECARGKGLVDQKKKKRKPSVSFHAFAEEKHGVEIAVEGGAASFTHVRVRVSTLYGVFPSSF